MTTIVGLILLTFGINEANDELNIFNKGNETTVVELPLFSKGRKVSDALRREIEEERLRAEKNSQNAPSAPNGLALENIQDENDDARLKVIEKTNELEEIYKKYIEAEIRMYKCISDNAGAGEQKSEGNVKKLKKDFNNLKTKSLSVAEELYNLSNKWVNKSVKYVELAQLYGDAQDKRLAAAQRSEANEYVSNSHRVKTQKFQDDLDCTYKPIESFTGGTLFSTDAETKDAMELAKWKEDATAQAAPVVAPTVVPEAPEAPTAAAAPAAAAEPAVPSVAAPVAQETVHVRVSTNPQKSEADCEKWALKNGMKVGGGGYEFSGDYGTKGCYYYSGGKYENMTFWGTKVGKCETKGEHICAETTMPTGANGFTLMGSSIQDSNETILSLGAKKRKRKRKRKPASLTSKFSDQFSDINVKKLLAPAWQYMGLPEMRKGLMGK